MTNYPAKQFRVDGQELEMLGRGMAVTLKDRKSVFVEPGEEISVACSWCVYLAKVDGVEMHPTIPGRGDVTIRLLSDQPVARFGPADDDL